MTLPVEEVPDISKSSDGFHSFEELYEHRHALFIRLCLEIWRHDGMDPQRVWRSLRHSDSSFYDGWFIMGIDSVKGEQITYHLPIKLWCFTHFAKTLEKAPPFDGHSSSDVLDRLYRVD